MPSGFKAKQNPTLYETRLDNSWPTTLYLKMPQIQSDKSHWIASISWSMSRYWRNEVVTSWKSYWVISKKIQLLGFKNKQWMKKANVRQQFLVRLNNVISKEIVCITSAISCHCSAHYNLQQSSEKTHQLRIMNFWPQVTDKEEIHKLIYLSSNSFATS